MKHLKVTLTPIAGASLSRCIEEARELAKAHGEAMDLVFNGTHLIVHEGACVECITRQFYDLRKSAWLQEA